MKRLLPILSLFSISFSLTALAGEKNYEVKLNCESRINKTSLISFRSSYETDTVDNATSLIRLLPSGKIQMGDNAASFIELVGNPYQFSSESDSFVTQDSMGTLNYDNANPGPVLTVENLDAVDSRDSTCEPLELERKKITQEISFSTPTTEEIGYDSNNKDDFSYINKHALESKIKNGTLKLKFACKISTFSLNNSEACH